MNTDPDTDPGPGEQPPAGGVADSLRAAVERTMKATTGSAQSTAERAGELVDDVVRRGRGARGQLARRGQEATGEVGRRLEALERRLAELENSLGDRQADPQPPPDPYPDPKAEG